MNDLITFASNITNYFFYLGLRFINIHMMHSCMCLEPFFQFNPISFSIVINRNAIRIHKRKQKSNFLLSPPLQWIISMLFHFKIKSSLFILYSHNGSHQLLQPSGRIITRREIIIDIILFMLIKGIIRTISNLCIISITIFIDSSQKVNVMLPAPPHRRSLPHQHLIRNEVQ
jgi:hypothetical protein